MDSKKHTILIIEDNELNRELLEEMLCDEYNLYTADNGQIGLQQLKEHASEIDVVLLDIQMPVMDGYEVLRSVAKNPLLKEIPIVITTASEDNDEELRCLRLGAVDFVTKPYKSAVVKLRVSNIIRLKESTNANIQKSKFIHNMNHEIRTPMNAIMGFSQLLGMPSETLTDEERGQYSEYIMSNALLLLSMIDDMIALSDADNGEMRINKGETQINKVCHDATTTIRFVVPDGVKVYCTSDVPDDYTLITDAKRVQQILVNFLTNACKNTTQGEIHVHCSTSENAGCLTLSVADTGIGVPADKAEIIFERFVKLDAFKPGTGLGLSITRTAAQWLGGDVYLDKTYTHGARFVLKLPICTNDK